MPTLADLNRRFASMQTQVENAIALDESFIQDSRSSITPVEAIESKLGTALIRKSFGSARKRNIISSRPR